MASSTCFGGTHLLLPHVSLTDFFSLVWSTSSKASASFVLHLHVTTDQSSGASAETTKGIHLITALKPTSLADIWVLQKINIKPYLIS